MLADFLLAKYIDVGLGQEQPIRSAALWEIPIISSEICYYCSSSLYYIKLAMNYSVLMFYSISAECVILVSLLQCYFTI